MQPLTAAESALVAQHFGLCWNTVDRWIKGGRPLPFGMEREDAAQACVEALVRAIRKFDPSKGYRLSTYATTACWRHLVTMVQVATREKRKPPGVTFRIMSDQFDSDGLRMAGNCSGFVVGIHDAEPFQEELDERERDYDAGAAAMAAIATLEPVREREVLQGRLRGETLREIGKRLGVTKERVRQLESRALATLREMVG